MWQVSLCPVVSWSDCPAPRQRPFSQVELGPPAPGCLQEALGLHSLSESSGLGVCVWERSWVPRTKHLVLYILTVFAGILLQENALTASAGFKLGFCPVLLWVLGALVLMQTPLHMELCHRCQGDLIGSRTGHGLWVLTLYQVCFLFFIFF